MVISLIHPHTCGFAKAAIWRFTKDVTEKIKRNDNETPNQHRVRSVQVIHERFSLMFTNKKFAVDFKTFQRKLPDLRKKFRTWSPRRKKEREQYFKAFSADNWKALSIDHKREHSLMDCRGYFHRYSVYQSFFPVQSKQFSGCLKENPVIVAHNITANTTENVSKIKSTRREYQDGAQRIYDEINPVFQRVFNVPLEKALTTIPSLNLQNKKSPTETKRARRKQLRQAKTSIEEHWKNTSVIRCYGNRQSLAAAERSRLTMAFESKEVARQRKETPTGTQKKNPVGNLANIEFDKENMKREVESFPDDVVVNWSDLARRYKIMNTKGELAKNGGQIAQEWLKSEGMNITRFKRKHDGNGDERVRRKKLRGQGGEISVPTPQSVGSVKEELRNKIISGEYTVGQQIAPRKYEKMVLNEDGEIVRTEFVVEGRKQPLVEIRERTLKSQAKFMRHRTDDDYDNMDHECAVTFLKALNEHIEGESIQSMRNRLKDIERTRHLKIWHDLSTIANHGHLVFMPL